MISVCMAVYNGEKYLAEQVSSILSQLGSNDELVISDNGSTDASLSILQTFHDSRIKIFKATPLDSAEKKYGEFAIIMKIKANFINALTHASGDLIFLADQDDIWLPEKVSRMAAALETYELAVHSCSIIDDSGKVILESSYNQFSRPTTAFFPILYRNPFQGCCMAFRASILPVLLDTGIMSKACVSHDHIIGYAAIVRASQKKGKGVFFEQTPLILYRRHSNNASPSSMKSNHSLRFKLKYRYNCCLLYLNLLRKTL